MRLIVILVLCHKLHTENSYWRKAPCIMLIIDPSYIAFLFLICSWGTAPVTDLSLMLMLQYYMFRKTVGEPKAMLVIFFSVQRKNKCPRDTCKSLLLGRYAVWLKNRSRKNLFFYSSLLLLSVPHCIITFINLPNCILKSRTAQPYN